jgi:hypothetical protein
MEENYQNRNRSPSACILIPTIVLLFISDSEKAAATIRE